MFAGNEMDWMTHTISTPISGKRVYAVCSKLGIDAMKKLPGEGFKRAGLPLIKVDEAVKAKVNQLFNR